MSSGSRTVSDLTRALILGASLGGVSLVSVGCAPTVTTTPQSDTQAVRDLCARVLSTKDPRDLEQLFQSYPTSSCLNPTLSALPPQTLTQVSPAVLAGVPTSVRNRIPPAPKSLLRFPQQRGDSGGSKGY